MKFKLFGRGGKRQAEEVLFRAEPLAAAIQGEVLEKYPVESAYVFIADQDGRGLYLVSEPELTPEEQRLYSLLMENLYFSLKPAAKIEDPMRYVEGFIWEAAEDLGVVEAVQSCFQKLKYFIARDAFGYGRLHVPMLDPDVEEISVTSYATPATVIHRRYTQYDWLQTNIGFESEDALRNYVQRLAQRAGKSVTVAVPMCDAMTREGHRIAVTFADEVTLPGSTLCVRKFPESPLSMAHLLKFRTLTPLMAAYFWIITEYRGFIMVLGPMSGGKTTFTNCLLTMINPVMKIATIEDVPELRIPHQSWQRFKARHVYSITEARFDIDLMDLVKLSLRYRPDYIVIGEVRGEEIRALVQAAAIGHGCLCLPQDEPIVFMDGQRAIYGTMGDLVEGVLAGRYRNVSILSLDTSTWKVAAGRVKRVFKVPSGGKVLRVRLEGGKELRVSPDHPLLVMDGDGLKVKPASEASAGDRVPVLRRLSFEPAAELDLLETGIFDDAEIYVDPGERVRSLLSHENARRALRSAGFTAYSGWARGRSPMPLKAYLTVEAAFGDKSLRRDVRLRYGKKSKKSSSIPCILQLNADLGAILGWYLAEGRMSRGMATFHFGRPREENLIRDFQDRFRKAFPNVPLSIHAGKKATSLRAMSRALGLFFKAFGGNCCEKRIPGFLLNAPDQFKRELVKWYWMGDGCAARHGKPLARTPSRDLAYGLIWLLKSMAVDAGLRVRRKNGADGGKTALFAVEVMGDPADFCEAIGASACTACSFADTLPALSEKARGRNENRLAMRNGGPLNRVKPQFRGPFDVYFSRIVEVAEEEYHGWLYDVETEHGNFAHSTCVVSHNCTLHAEDPEAALVRMRSPPMDVAEGGLMLIWCFALLNRTKTPDGTVVRRVFEATEVEPRDGRLELKRIFTWNARDDTFTPESADEVVKHSYRLRTVKRLTGWTDSELAEELERRAEYLVKAVDEGKLNYPDFAEAIRRFYTARMRGAR